MQTKTDSALEALTNILIGAGIALLAQFIWFPIIGKNFTLTENLMTTAFFTIVSFTRSYSLRRLFDGKSVYFKIKKILHSHNWETTHVNERQHNQKQVCKCGLSRQFEYFSNRNKISGMPWDQGRYVWSDGTESPYSVID